jgi:uncharacterized protein (TIGR02145 family)
LKNIKRMKNNISYCMLVIGMLFLILTGCTKDEEKPPEPVVDINGNSYKTIKIGAQIWMADNLKTTKYNDGTEIPLVTSSAAWGYLSTPGYCWYNNNEALYKDTCGALYNGYSVITGKLCPSGWHIPAREEWQKLREFLGDTTSGGGHLKDTGTLHWLTPNKDADNSSGFAARGAGIRYFEGTFASYLYSTCIWSSTETGTNEEWYFSLYYGDAAANMSHKSKKYGFSVRCVKD